MPRPLREIVPGGIYHVTARGNNRENIFLGGEDRDAYMEFVRQVKETFDFEFYLYVLMTNHVHLILRTSLDPEKSISRIMKSLALRYTKYFNKKYSRTGNLLQQKYFSELLKEDRHLLELTRYIHLNPVRAKLVETVGNYPYSSYPCYIGAAQSKLIDCLEILGFFAKQERVQRKRYKMFVEDGQALWQLRVKSTASCNGCRTQGKAINRL